MFTLDPRLEKVGEIIGQCNTLADIGSDHGYLPIYLIKNSKINYALITDMNKGPLENAKKTARKYKAEEKCHFLLGDGLAPLKNEIDHKVDTISICGMGGELISAILKDNLDIAKKSNLVLQPMNNPAVLRKFLLENGFMLHSEAIIRDDYHFYQMFGAKYAFEDTFVENYTQYDYEFARELINKKDATMLEYLQYKLDVQNKICDNIMNNSPDNEALKTKSLEMLEAIKERIAKYDS